jgi:hypothetical protein
MSGCHPRHASIATSARNSGKQDQQGVLGACERAGACLAGEIFAAATGLQRGFPGRCGERVRAAAARAGCASCRRGVVVASRLRP